MARRNLNTIASAHLAQHLMLTEERKKKAVELILSINELVADNKKKIQKANELISENKKRPVIVSSPCSYKKGAAIASPDSLSTEFKFNELYMQMESQKTELLQAKDELEQFIYAASHDLQEPLRIISGFLTQLHKKYNHLVDDTGKEYIRHAVFGAKMMRQIILDLGEFSLLSRLEYGEDEVDLHKTLKKIQHLYRKEIMHRRAKIVYSGPPVVTSHESAIRRIFESLISNSLKFSGPDVPVEIKISVTAVEGFLQFEVSDNGIGIAPEYFDKIFVVFQSLHCKRPVSGSGMGLSITKKIVEKLGGKIWVKSEEGKGCNFYFTLPRREVLLSKTG